MRTESSLCVIVNKKPVLYRLFIFLLNMYRVFFFLVFSFKMFSQDTLMPVIFLDDVVISEENSGFSVEDFVDYVKKDTTFYMGFKHLRFYSHNYESTLNIFNKRNDTIGIIKKWGKHTSNGSRAFISNDSIFYQGKLFKRNGEYRFYTPKAFDEVFFPQDTIDVSLKISKNKDSNNSQNMRDAKTVSFSIGSDDTERKNAGVNKKLAVFSIDMQKYYDYIISDTIYNDKSCYVFIVKLKEDLKKKDKKDALIHKIVSFFDKENFHVIYREYEFEYNHLLFDLDIDVIVHMDYVNNVHVPIKIYYRGFWNVMFFKPERSEFVLENYDYIVE